MQGSTKNRPSMDEITVRSFRRTMMGILLEHLDGKIDYILDTETTGLDVRNTDAIQIAIVDYKTGEVVFNKYFMPTVPINVGATRVHGKTEESLKEAGAEKFSKSDHEELAALLKDKTVTGYNIQFDVCMLEGMMYRYGMSVLEFGGLVDLMPILSTIYGRWNSHRKQFAWQKLSTFNINKREMHDALSDCLIIHDYVNHIKKILKG